MIAKQSCVLFMILVLVVLQQQPVYAQVNLTTVLSWNTISFQYPSYAEEMADIDRGWYDPQSTALIDVDAEVKNNVIQRYFLTFQRLMGATPITLGTVVGTGKNIKVHPYPDFARNRPVCGPQNLINVFRIQYQPECNRLWVLDTGIFGSLRCPPKVIAYDLNTNQAVFTYIIPEALYEPDRSILVTIVVETLNTCSNTFIYVADCQAYSIIVIDVARSRSWRATDKTMYPSPECGTINIQNESFELMDGVLGMALRKDTYNRLYYYPLSSGRMHWVYTHLLRNESLFMDDPWAHPEFFNSYKTVRPTQSAGFAIDSEGVGYSGLVEESSLVCWNTQSSEYGTYMKEFFRNQVTMQFATGVKMIRDGRGEHVFVVTPRLQKVILGSINPADENYRVSAVSTHYIYPNTYCNIRNYSGTKYYSTSPCNVCDSSKYRLTGYPYGG